MSILKQFFRKFTLSPLKRNIDVTETSNEQIKMLKNNGFEILSTIQKENVNLILYRKFYDETPKDEVEYIFIGIRAITQKGILGRDPVLKAFFKNNFTAISLEDIEMEDSLVNQGFGSILLTTLIDIANKRNINRITGEIARVDIDHIERLVRFYKKHNFEVNMCSGHTNRQTIAEFINQVWIILVNSTYQVSQEFFPFSRKKLIYLDN